MTMTKCRECKTGLSKKAKVCLSCGTPVPLGSDKLTKNLSSDHVVADAPHDGKKFSNREAIIEYMKAHYPHSYAQFSNGGELDHKATFKAIESCIKESKKYHIGMDMSGMKSLLSTIKLERIALGDIDANQVRLFDYQWVKVDDMIANGIVRHDPYAPADTPPLGPLGIAPPEEDSLFGDIELGTEPD
tara:strand:- start:3650 stop:4213 length:564 start_codon:yes stop_codon:yes gene_type:complete